MEVAREARLDEECVVASHADPNNAKYLLRETECYLIFTIGYP